MSKNAKTLVGDAMAPLEGLDIPESLAKSIATHQANLVNLASALLDGGQSQEDVRHTIDALLSSYKTELTNTILALRDR